MSALAIEETEAGRDERPATAKIWDPFVRIFHWSLVVLFALAWATEDAQALHQPVGWAILSIVALRIVWGFVGSGHARFADFIRTPRARSPMRAGCSSARRRGSSAITRSPAP